MNATEKIVIDSLIKNLRDSLRTTWTQGDFEQWTAYARRMKLAIQHTTEIMESLSKASNNDVDNLPHYSPETDPDGFNLGDS